MAKLLFRVLLILLLPLAAQAQTGTLKGVIKDEAGNALMYAEVSVQKNGENVSSTQSNDKGEFTIKPINPGSYDVVATYMGLQSERTEGVQIVIEKITFLDIVLKKAIVTEAISIKKYKVPLIDPDFKSGSTKTAEDIIKSPLNNVADIASTTAGVYAEDNGSGELNIRGSRASGTLYYVDGIKLRSSIELPKLGLEQITVITGGFPARYGDATGGLVVVTTKGPSRKHEQGVNFESSKFLDGYDNNTMEFFFLGPLYKSKTKPLFVGYSLLGQLHSMQDPRPSAVGVWTVKDSAFADLQQNPLAPSPTGQGTIRRAELLTKDDLLWKKAHQNGASKGFTLTSKIEIRPTKKLNFTLGAYANYVNNHADVYNYSLLNYENNPMNTVFNWRLYAKMSQKIGVQDEDLTDDTKKPLVKNMYYTLQVDFDRLNSTSEDDSHGDNIFEYGYIGQFKTSKEKTYTFDSLGASGAKYYMQGWQDTQYDLLKVGNNQTASRYTQQYYDFYNGFVKDNYENYAQVQKGGALLNGDRPQHVYDIWYNTGRQSNGYSKSQDDQFRLIGSLFADIKNHEVNMGFEYERRIIRSYGISPMGLWTVARQLANAKNIELDKSTAIIVGDSVDYNRLYVPTIDPVTGKVINGFFENVRTKTGNANTDFVDTDNLTPDDLSLSMFNASELLQSGNNSLYNGFGYDYLGNSLSNSASFGNFFTQTDGNNALLRNAPAFQPIYMAGYIQDKFVFNDIIFNVGLRVDRYDANQMVPNDLYSLYPIKSAKEARDEGISIPTNIGDNYKVYVTDQNAALKTATGFRDENNNWYNAQGTEINDPSIIASSSSTGTITPYLENPKANVKSSNFDFASSFKKYEAQYTVCPRISFSFPISDEAMFFAHYDILAERPMEGISRNDPMNYLFMENLVGGLINNPNLKPQKTTDYELGFAQKLTKSSAINISAFYREMKDMMQLTQIRFAYPVNYLTFQNIDFGTVKGLSIAYDLRRTKNIKMGVNYTLQFAEGTGSGAFSSLNILNSGSPNLRTIMPLDFDRRHNVNLEVDYRYGQGKNYDGPSWGRKILAGAGINFLVRTGSGTPYSRQSNITEDIALSKSQSRTLSGQINGSRLPWTFRIDLRADKNVVIKFGQEKDKQKTTVLNVYLSVNNLLNTRNILNVYHYTGNPNDDGFLTAAVSQQEINAKVNRQSFIDLYSVAINSPNNYSLPRLIKLGAIYNF
ncbi:MAG: carboxypeptidase regulatory-like domain-containing protein [Bacteroidetes bacterium]|nr:carboxypeptidase regulatory-like domain-containing protein [Bacteroidota bacterium]